MGFYVLVDDFKELQCSFEGKAFYFFLSSYAGDKDSNIKKNSLELCIPL